MRYLIIAGHGRRRNGSFDPGATGFITQGEHRYTSKTLFPAMRKYADDRFIFLDSYNVFDRGNIVALAKSYGVRTAVVEIHFDASSSSDASGGHVIIHRDYDPDAMDLRIRDVIDDMVGVRYSHKGHRGISGRNNLANVNRTRYGGVNFRLVELGFGTNKKDANVLTTNVDEYARKLVGAISGEDATPAKKPSPKPSKPAPSKNKRSIATMATEVRRGDHGNGKAARMKSLGVSEEVYQQVQDEVNRQIVGVTPSNPKPKTKTGGGVGSTVTVNKLYTTAQSAKNVRSTPITGYVADVDNSRMNPLRLMNKKGGYYIGFSRTQDIVGTSSNQSKPLNKPRISAGQNVRTKSLYGSAQSNKNVRTTPINGYIADIDNSRRNPIRLRNKRGGHYIGFTRVNDII